MFFAGIEVDRGKQRRPSGKARTRILGQGIIKSKSVHGQAELGLVFHGHRQAGRDSRHLPKASRPAPSSFATGGFFSTGYNGAVAKGCRTALPVDRSQTGRLGAFALGIA